MKNINLKLLSLAIVATIGACSVFKTNQPVYAIDPVCHMKIDKSEAFTYKYKDVKYYFDNVNCQKAFEMDPEAILQKNNCDPKK